MKKVGTLLLTLSLSASAFAGFNGVTHHSRANCVNNESISWDWTHDWWFWVNSVHRDRYTGGIYHQLPSGWIVTWRNAMVHWGESRPGGRFEVEGLHYMMGPHNQPVLVAHEIVTDCSIYDGWWDRNR